MIGDISLEGGMAPDIYRASVRFWQRVQRAPSGCWIWTGAKCGTKGEYGQVSIGRRRILAHRFAYELLVGPIPEGLELDHLCRHGRCVNPLHLSPVTHAENVRRGTGPIPAQARRTHCIHGHPFDAENTYVRTNGKRQCKTCYRETSRRHRAA